MDRGRPGHARPRMTAPDRAGRAGARGPRPLSPGPRGPRPLARRYGGVMDDTQILRQIDELVSEEHDLRGKVARGELSTQQEHDRLRKVEEALAQCWDLLRHRRPRPEDAENPAPA